SGSRLVGGKRCLLWHHINSGTPDFGSPKLQLCGFIAQWLEHWSSKPGVVSSILTGACALQFYGNHHVKNCACFQPSLETCRWQALYHLAPQTQVRYS